MLNDSHDRDLVSELSTELDNAASANAAKAGDVAALRRHMLRLQTALHESTQAALPHTLHEGEPTTRAGFLGSRRAKQ